MGWLKVNSERNSNVEIREYGTTSDPLDVTRTGASVRMFVLKLIHKMCILISESCFLAYIIIWKTPKVPPAKKCVIGEEPQITISFYCNNQVTGRKIKRNAVLFFVI